MTESTVWMIRARVNALLLGQPDDIPPQRMLPLGFSATGWRDLRYWADASQSCGAEMSSLASLAGRALSHLPEIEGLAALTVPDCLTAADPHDAYFRIVRIEDRPGVSYLRGLLQALAVFADEAADPSDAEAYQVIPRVLCGLWCDVMGVPLADDARQPAPDRPPMRRLTSDPVRRWLRGHQIFAVLTQGLIWAMQLLLDASAAGFRFTADFESVHYRDTIRPSMSEPHVPKGFSGTLSTDHAHLVRMMASLGPLLAQLQQQHPAAHAAMSKALAAVYEDHKLVCERFDGAMVPSLRGQRARTEGPSGTEMLDRFKHRRMAMLG